MKLKKKKRIRMISARSGGVGSPDGGGGREGREGRGEEGLGLPGRGGPRCIVSCLHGRRCMRASLRALLL